MKKRIIQGLCCIILVGLAACRDQNGNKPQLDTMQPATSPLPIDTTQKDTMVNNGERLQGTDTSARHK